MPLYEYRCEACGKRSTALLRSFDAPDPACPHCGSSSVRRLVSAFATTRSTEESDFGSDFDEGLEGSGEEGFDSGDGFDDDF